jgi:hypothetical protein
MEEKSLQEQVREYDESQEFSEYRFYWTDRVYYFFYDGYLCSTNEHWIDAKLKACDYASLYKHIITKLEMKLKNENLTDQDRKYLTERLTDNRQMFYNELASMIRDYCIG